MDLAVLDLDQVRAWRMSSHSRANQSGERRRFTRVRANINISRPVSDLNQVSLPRPPVIVDPMEEIAWGPALWMWDYLRRSGARGFLLPLSGGADSSAVAALVASMARIVFQSIEGGNQETLARIRTVVKMPDFTPTRF